MKSIQFFLVAVICLTLASCGAQWDGGLWIVPALTGLGALIFGYKTIVSSTSGSVKTNQYGSKDYKGNVVNKGYLIFTLVLTVATIVIIWMINGDK
jgi:hypothetical protein